MEYTHAVVQKDNFEDKIVTICSGWIDAHNFMARHGRRGMRIVAIESIDIKTKELSAKEAEEYGKRN